MTSKITLNNTAAQPIPPTLHLTKQAIYRCANCRHEGIAERVTVTRWRWWHYLVTLFFPLGTLIVYSNTAPIKRCASCHATKLRRLHHDQLPKPPPLSDPNSLRNARHRKIGIVVLVAVIFLNYAIPPLLEGFQRGYQEATDAPENIATNTQSDDQAARDAILAADYAEGHKAGYADGRSPQGSLADSYAPPATEERKESYATGYIDGFKLGCDEGDFDCTEQLRQLETDTGDDAAYQ